MDLRSRGEASQKDSSIMDDFTVTIIENREDGKTKERKKEKKKLTQCMWNSFITQKPRRLDSNKM